MTLTSSTKEKATQGESIIYETCVHMTFENYQLYTNAWLQRHTYLKTLPVVNSSKVGNICFLFCL